MARVLLVGIISILSISVLADEYIARAGSMSMQWRRTAPVEVKHYSMLEIKKAQARLFQEGYNLSVDGVMDEETRRAILDFQYGKNLQATGRLNNQTMVELGVEPSMVAEQEKARTRRPASVADGQLAAGITEGSDQSIDP